MRHNTDPFRRKWIRFHELGSTQYVVVEQMPCPGNCPEASRLLPRRRLSAQPADIWPGDLITRRQLFSEACRYHLLWAYDPLHPDEEKWFLVRDPLEDKLETWLHVAFARWPVERVLEDKKSELGYSHFEVRKYQAVMRHLYITMVSHLFLARQTAELRGEKSADHIEPGPRRRQCAGKHAVV